MVDEREGHMVQDGSTGIITEEETSAGTNLQKGMLTDWCDVKPSFTKSIFRGESQYHNNEGNFYIHEASPSKPAGP